VSAITGYNELVDGIKLGVPFGLGDIVTTRAYAAQHEDVVKRFLRGYLDAWRFVSNPANKAEMVKIFEKYAKADEKTAEGGYLAQLPVWQSQKVPVVTLEAFSNDLLFASDPKLQSADPKQFFDNSHIEAVAAEVGLR
jgi:ABC-type nitrate/sulfonate/bicarbonate transport system substrate-binding protein